MLLTSKKKSKDKPKCKWDNGKDWRDPSNAEGDWVRIYPFHNKHSNSWSSDPITLFGDDQIRHIVAKVAKYYKNAREIFNHSKKFNDFERDETILSIPSLASTVWHPSKRGINS